MAHQQQYSDVLSNKFWSTLRFRVDSRVPNCCIPRQRELAHMIPRVGIPATCLQDVI